MYNLHTLIWIALRKRGELFKFASERRGYPERGGVPSEKEGEGEFQPWRKLWPVLESQIFETIYLYYIFNSKTSKISPNQHAGLLRFLFTEDYLKIKKDLELVFIEFFVKCYINWPYFITRLCLLPKLFNKMCFVFYA